MALPRNRNDGKRPRTASRVAAVLEPGGTVLGVIENPHFAPADPPARAGEGPGR